LEILAAHDPQHGAAGVPFKDLEAAARFRLNYRALTDALIPDSPDGSPRIPLGKPDLIVTSAAYATC